MASYTQSQVAWRWESYHEGTPQSPWLSVVIIVTRDYYFPVMPISTRFRAMVEYGVTLKYLLCGCQVLSLSWLANEGVSRSDTHHISINALKAHVKPHYLILSLTLTSERISMLVSHMVAASSARLSERWCRRDEWILRSEAQSGIQLCCYSLSILELFLIG